MRSPLIVKYGQMEILTDDDKLLVPRLNLGPTEPLIASETININANIHHLLSYGSKRKVSWIFGGEEGDILILTGENVQLKSDGNIAKATNLREDEAVTLYFINNVWVQSR